MKKNTKKIIFAIAVILAVVEFYSFFSGKSSRQPENIQEKQTTQTPDSSGAAENPSGNMQDEIASGTYKNVNESEAPSKQDRKPNEPVLTLHDVLYSVPFMSQAPFGNWDDPRKQDGCEEAAAIMAMAWVKNESLDAKSVDEKINSIAKYEEEKLGTYHDTSAFDTAETIFKGYFAYDNVEVKYRIKKEDIIKELMAGNLVIVPTRGQLLGNPNYTPPGPVTHNVVVIGYDVKTKEFVTNDPGTRKGKAYRYDEDVLMDAVFDYPTGFHEKMAEEKTAMIIVSK